MQLYKKQFRFVEYIFPYGVGVYKERTGKATDWCDETGEVVEPPEAFNTKYAWEKETRFVEAGTNG